MPSKKGGGKRSRELASFTIDRELVEEVGGVLLMALGVMTLLALFSATKGVLSGAWVRLLRRAFGWGVYPVAVGIVFVGVLVLWDEFRERHRVALRRIVGAELAFVALLGLSHLSVVPAQGYELAARGDGGGYLGWAVSYYLAVALGRGLAGLLLVALTGAGTAVALNVRREDLLAGLGALVVWLRRVAESTSAAPEPAAPAPRPPRKRTRPSERVERAARAAEQRTSALPKGRRAERLSPGLPPLDLLNGGKEETAGSADSRFKKQLIEETLAHFGVPAEVVEANRGPAVTQFGVEPGFQEYHRADGTVRRRKVKVSTIMSLQDDLALALAAKSIRIEAPVPGRSVVGVEVPNDTVSLVGLRGVLESTTFRGIASKLGVALGRDVSGEPVAVDLGAMPHLLIAGATGSGKSVCINAITASLLLNNAPETLSLLMVDPKMVELTLFNGVPHLLAPVITSAEQAVRALRWVTQQMDLRFRLFSQAGARNIEAYNELMTAQKLEALTYIVILIDELADLMMVAPDEIERHICRIAQLARATGIHLVVATQRPSVDVITGLIKANFPARISFAVTSQVDSRVILDTQGAEKLLGRGDMLFMSPESSTLLRLQGCFVSDEELQRLVAYWKEKAGAMQDVRERAPWADMEEAGDELLDRAIDLARERQSISISFLQRHLRIGYPRAARLVDQLEQQGVVGPAVNGGRSRDVLAEDEVWEDEEESDENFSSE